MIEVITTSDGTKFAGYSQDYLFQIIKNGDNFPDKYVKDVIDKYVTKDSICIDVGANLGYISVYLAKKCKYLYSFEPQKNVYFQLCANLFLNECYNVTTYNKAVYSYNKNFDFASFQSGWVGTKEITNVDKVTSFGAISLTPSETGKIKAVTLDETFSEKIDFIKIDAQGADIDVIFGADNLISRDKPVIVFEYEEDLSLMNYNRTLSDLNYFLKRHSYKMIEIHHHNYLLIHE